MGGLLSVAMKVVFAFALTAVLGASALVTGPWSDVSAPPAQRAKLLLANMTLADKLQMLHGPPTGPCCQCKTAECAYVGNVAPNSRLGIPPITMNDGPQGFRDNNHHGTTTAWPSGLTMAASWDVAAVRQWGVGMGKEFYDKGANVQLGPGLCVARVPRNGRNFEYLSGEDPMLGKVLVGPVIEGIQSQKVVANAKHWVNNNQETARTSVSEEVDERTRFEMYYPPFEGAIEAGVGSFMCSYNKINGAWSCENPTTLKQDLKERLGFKGYVMSDWGATHSMSIMKGMDMEMPSAGSMNVEKLTAGIQSGNVTMAAIDDSVTRILTPMFSVGVMDEPVETWSFTKLKNNVTSDAAAESARQLSAVSTVLLKNAASVLPLQKGAKIALIGFATDGAVVHAGGSGSVVPSFIVNPLAGITEADSSATITFNDGTNVSAAAAMAAAADYAIVFVGTLSSEGSDRQSLSLDDGCSSSESACNGNANNQNAMVEAVAATATKTIVVASVPGAVLMPWSPKVDAILTNFMPGQQAGHAIADVLFGKVNPSGKLPLTFPNKENETALTPAQWPGLPDPSHPTYANYSERLLIGYRYYDQHDIQFTTGFPFGHGLSYTTFEYDDIKFDSSTMAITFTVKNTGSVEGAEVAQLYVGFPAHAGEPPKQLKGFSKATLAPGETVRVSLPLTERDFSIWDVDAHAWKQVAGKFTFMVGSSSRDVRLSNEYQM